MSMISPSKRKGVFWVLPVNLANPDEIVKSIKAVTPKAGVQNSLILLNSRFRGNDRKDRLRLVTRPSILAYSTLTSASFFLASSDFGREALLAKGALGLELSVKN
jgi:hypothetical protein